MDSNTILIALIIKFFVVTGRVLYVAKKQADQEVERKIIADELESDTFRNAFKRFLTIYETLVFVIFVIAFTYWYFHFHYGAIKI